MPILRFNNEYQVQINWCWAAVSKNISFFYNIRSQWSQCLIARAEMNLPCCTNPCPNGCNVPWYLDRALAITGNFVGIINAPIPANTIIDELNKGHVIGARIGWTGGGGHFVVIHGINDNVLSIADPYSGSHLVPLQEFTTNYQGNGNWTHTYLTTNILTEIKSFTEFKNDFLNENEFPRLQELILESNKITIMKKDLKTYLIGLDQINENFDFKTIDSGHLTTLNENKTFDLKSNEKNISKFLNRSIDPERNNAFDKTYKKAEIASKDQKNIEIRFLKLPALNIDAIWISNIDNPDADKFLPINTFGTTLKEEYSNDEFLRYIKRIASSISKDDDLLGS